MYISIGLKYRPLQLRTALSFTLLYRFVFKLHYEHIQFKKKKKLSINHMYALYVLQDNGLS